MTKLNDEEIVKEFGNELARLLTPSNEAKKAVRSVRLLLADVLTTLQEEHERGLEKARKDERERFKLKLWAVLDETGEVEQGGAAFLEQALTLPLPNDTAFGFRPLTKEEYERDLEKAYKNLDRILVSMSWQERNETPEAIRVLAEIREQLKEYTPPLPDRPLNHERE